MGREAALCPVLLSKDGVPLSREPSAIRKDTSQNTGAGHRPLGSYAALPVGGGWEIQRVQRRSWVTARGVWWGGGTAICL